MTVTAGPLGHSQTLRTSARNINGVPPLDHGGRPPVDVIPPRVRSLLDSYDALRRQEQDLGLERRELDDPARDEQAAKADAQDSADAMRAGKVNPTPTAHRQKLAEDRRACRDRIDALTTAVADCANELAEAREAEAQEPSHRKVVDKARTDAANALTKAIDALEHLASIEALDDWLAHTGNPYNPRTHLHISDVATELDNRGVHRDDAGAVRVTDLLTRLRDNVA